MEPPPPGADDDPPPPGTEPPPGPTMYADPYAAYYAAQGYGAMPGADAAYQQQCMAYQAQQAQYAQSYADWEKYAAAAAAEAAQAAYMYEANRLAEAQAAAVPSAETLAHVASVIASQLAEKEAENSRGREIAPAPAHAEQGGAPATFEDGAAGGGDIPPPPLEPPPAPAPALAPAPAPAHAPAAAPTAAAAPRAVAANDQFISRSVSKSAAAAAAAANALNAAEPPKPKGPGWRDTAAAAIAEGGLLSRASAVLALEREQKRIERERQELTRVHFSAQLEPCLTQENTLHTLSTPYHPLNTGYTTPARTPYPIRSAQVELRSGRV